MRFTRRQFAAALACAPSALTAAAAATAAEPLTADKVHLELVTGHRRFLSGHTRHPHSSLAWAKRTGREGQHPHAVVLCCSDSRVSPEIIFDQGLGDLFVVRVAGNVVREDEIGSIEYAIEHLKVPLCVILAHTACGAVTAVVDNEHLPIEADHLISPIRTALTKVRSQHPQLKRTDLVDATVRTHLKDSCLSLAHAIPHHRVEGALYNLNTLRVEWLSAI